jgi:hypothetical protein
MRLSSRGGGQPNLDRFSPLQAIFEPGEYVAVSPTDNALEMAVQGAIAMMLLISE